MPPTIPQSFCRTTTEKLRDKVMPYTELIKQEGEYKYSANIQFDIENDHKLGRFIPNETTIDLFREYFIDISRPQPLCHSRILYGSYGTGKSHFLTVLSLLLGKTQISGEGYRTFLARIRELDSHLASDIQAFVKSRERKPFLVVPIVFDFEDFDRCLYFSLKKKLDSIGKKVSFKTFYDQAASLLRQWRQNEESQNRLLAACQKAGVSIEELEGKLERLEKNSEAVFQQVFSEMTFGVKYIYEVTNILDAIGQANRALQAEYAGIVFIFDEFGRYIEDNIKNIKVKSIQDLAEFCDHCDGNNHIILVSHKEISQYTQRYGKSVANEWKKVEGRYKATPINDKQDQCLSLIRNILIKDREVWSRFKDRFQAELNHIYAEASDFKGFLVDAAHGENPFEGGFPLHPISLYALDKLSKKVAQNERTFFTYLAGREENSLYRFLSETNLEEFHFVGINEIYDYFEPSIKAIQSDAGYEWYKNLQSALAKCRMVTGDDKPEVKLLKVIAIIGIINDASTLRANKSTLLSVIDCPKEILSNALEGLCESRVVKYSGSYDRYEFYEASIYDVEAMIDEKSREVRDESVIHTLNEEFVDFALYPYGYNRNYKITRVFAPVYASPDTLTRGAVSKKLGQYYDGALIMLLADPDTELLSVRALSREIERTIFFVNRDSLPLKAAVRRYVAAKFLESKKAEYVKNDPSFEKELQYFKRELAASVFLLLRQWKNSRGEECRVVVDGEVWDGAASLAALSTLADQICGRAFGSTLIVNNELINKNTVSGSISAAKKNVITGILKGSRAEDYYDVAYLSPDYIAVRSVLTKNGFVSGTAEEQNRLSDGRRPQQDVRNAIDAFVNSAKSGTVSFGELYAQLKSPPYGLRDGYLSILFAHVLLPHKKSLIITSHDVEQELTVELFEEIVRRPNDYTLTIASWSSEQTDYLKALEQIFAGYINPAALNRNRLKAIYEAVMSHYKNVSKFARTTSVYVSDRTQRYRRLAERASTNYSAFFFKKMRELGSTYAEIIDAVKLAKSELEGAPEALSNDLANEICTLYGVSESVPLGALFTQRYQQQWAAKRQKSFDYYTNSFLEFAGGVHSSERDYEIIQRLAKTVTGLELVYWSDSHKEEFLTRLREVNARLDSYRGSAALSEGETKMTLVTSGGQERSIVFDTSELSGLGKTLKNKISATFGNYGLAISYDEKVQVLLSLIEELLEGK